MLNLGGYRPALPGRTGMSATALRSTVRTSHLRAREESAKHDAFPPP
jgi:hypothetical protein